MLIILTRVLYLYSDHLWSKTTLNLNLCTTKAKMFLITHHPQATVVVRHQQLETNRLLRQKKVNHRLLWKDAETAKSKLKTLKEGFSAICPSTLKSKSIQRSIIASLIHSQSSLLIILWEPSFQLCSEAWNKRKTLILQLWDYRWLNREELLLYLVWLLQML